MGYASFRNALYVALAIQLTGCAGLEGWQHRYGPDPAIPAEPVRQSTKNQFEIMEALAVAAHCDPDFPECWYLITIAGFNFVDEQCDAYLRELFVLDKERDRAKTFLSSADKLTNAILAVSPASKVTMAIVAQAFGLTSQYVDVATDSYLYGVPSGNILHVVSSLQLAYRDQTSAHRVSISSQPAAYAQIRGYLRLCMPPTIESKISTAIAKADAVSGNEVTNSNGPGTIQATELVTTK